MHSSLVILFCCLSAVLAYPFDQEYQPVEGFVAAAVPYAEVQQLEAYPEQHEQLHRVRRQFNLQGGGSPGKGLDINANARVPVWTSQNGRHSFDATGGYSQHLGGPYGNSRPDVRAGGVYTFRF